MLLNYNIKPTHGFSFNPNPNCQPIDLVVFRISFLLNLKYLYVNKYRIILVLAISANLILLN